MRITNKDQYLARFKARGKQRVKKTRWSDSNQEPTYVEGIIRRVEMTPASYGIGHGIPAEQEKRFVRGPFATRDPKTPYVPKFITAYAEDENGNRTVRLGRVRNPEWSE